MDMGDMFGGGCGGYGGLTRSSNVVAKKEEQPQEEDDICEGDLFSPGYVASSALAQVQPMPRPPVE